MRTRIDHLVIGAADLAQGVAYVKRLLRVDIPYGGEHRTMGTHNHLMRIGDDLFLEVLALDPGNDSLRRPRWYGLDDPHVRRSLQLQPSLLTWVVNTGNIETVMRRAACSFGTPTLIRRGDLSWYFGVPEDGRLLAGGMLPYVIQWLTDHHPSKKMADSGCRLHGLEIFHPFPTWLRDVLESIGAAELVKIHAQSKNEPARLAAFIDTPEGTVELLSCQRG